MDKAIFRTGKIDVSKALELRLKKGLSYTDIAEFFGVSRTSVHMALKRFNELLIAPAELTAYQAHKGAILESVEAKLLNDLVDKEKRAKASLNNTAYSLNVVSNLTRLEKGLSTSNVAYLDMKQSLEEIQAQRRQLQEALGEPEPPDLENHD
jgi:predicted DNA-binding protein YlxM (UPF0122 family)